METEIREKTRTLTVMARPLIGNLNMVLKPEHRFKSGWAAIGNSIPLYKSTFRINWLKYASFDKDGEI